jgi:hydrogenase maturation protease
MVEDHRTIAVIGCGNPNRSDDGVGSEVVRALRSRVAKIDRVRLLDAGTDGMGVMFAARECHSLIVIDACRSGSPAGAVFEVPGAELEARYRPSLTLHDFRWDHALFAGRQMFGGDFPHDVTVFLIEAATVDFGIGLSQLVEEAANRVATRVEELVKAKLLQPVEFSS